MSHGAAVVEHIDGTPWLVGAAVVAVGVGLVAGSPLLVAAAAIPLVYVAASTLGGRPDLDVAVERRLVVDGDLATDVAGMVDDPITGDPGDVVSVELTVRNRGSTPLVDLRMVDGVPASLSVVEGSPRGCVIVEAGGTATLRYGVELRRGEYEFDDATVRVRDLPGTTAVTRSVSVTGDDALACVPAVRRVPLGDGASDYAGEVPTDEADTGTEFYSVREYEPGDPVGAVDWRRYGRERELATVEYRAERATRIVCVVDARHSEFRVAPGTGLSAVSLSADAAERILETLTGEGHSTGVLVPHGERISVVPPGADDTTRERAKAVLEATRAGNTLQTHVRQLTGAFEMTVPQALPGEALVYLFSSFHDDAPVALVERLRAHGYTVRVVSPDVTAAAEDTPTRLTAVGRANRLARVRAAGARVVDWDLDRELELVLRDAVAEVNPR